VRARLLGAALALFALGQVSAKAADDDAGRPEDRAAVAACLKIGAAAPRDDVASPTGGKTDPAAWMAYFTRTPKPGPSSCVGVVSTPCLQRDPGGASGTTVDILDCLTREQRVWDERLNAAYKEWIQACQASKDDKICAARRKIERAWIAYRDALCGQPYEEHGGTFASVDFADCMLSETARQAIWVEAQK
jgi:uncharacterized protein YecT (DUF1311 family)